MAKLMASSNSGRLTTDADDAQVKSAKVYRYLHSRPLDLSYASTSHHGFQEQDHTDEFINV